MKSCTEDVGQVVKGLHNMYEALGSIISIL